MKGSARNARALFREDFQLPLLRSRRAFRRSLSLWFCACLAASPLSAEVMRDVSDLCHDPALDGRTLRATLESQGWQQAVVDRDGRYTDLATALVLDVTDGGTDLEARFAQAPALAGNFEQMVLSGSARIYEQGDALLFVGARLRPEGGEQVTCILGTPQSPETLSLMAAQGGPETDPVSGQIRRRVVLDDGNGRRSMRLWARLPDTPRRTPLPDLFYMERLSPPE